MAKWESPDGNRHAEVEPGVLGGRVVCVPRGFGYVVAGTTGVLPAALAANSTIFGMRIDSGTSRRLFLRALEVQWTTLAAFTTPVSAGRRLQLVRGTNIGAFTGGSQLTPLGKHSIADTSEVSSFNGGDSRIATNAALGNSGVFEVTPLSEFSLAHLGAAGAFAIFTLDFTSPGSQPLQLDPGQVIAIRTPIAMDAGGTWQATIRCEWDEAPDLDYQ